MVNSVKLYCYQYILLSCLKLLANHYNPSLTRERFINPNREFESEIKFCSQVVNPLLKRIV